MKTLLKIAAVLCLSLPSVSLAAGHSANVRVDPLSFLFGTFNIGADFAVSDSFTLGGGGSYASLSSGSTKATAWGFQARAQYFFTAAFTDSWYLAPFFTYASGTGEDGVSTDIDVTLTSMGAVIGYMWMWENFNIQLGGGLQNISIDTDSNNTSFSTIEGTLPTIEFTLGYAF